MRTNLFLISTLLICFSCTKEVDLDIPELPQKVVVNSLFCPDSVMQIHVSLTAGITEPKINNVDNATVKLFENDVLIKTIVSQQNGFYNSMYMPKVGKEYRVEVVVPGFDVVWAEDKVPENGPIQTFTCKVDDDFNQFGGQNSKTILSFQDIVGELSFFELLFYPMVNGNVYLNSGFGVSQTDKTNDFSIVADGDIDMNPLTIYFSDNLFIDQEKELEFNGFGSFEFNSATNQKIYNYFIADFKSVSKHYYNFRKSWTKHLFNQNSDAHYDDPLTLLFLGDPIEMYSNVTNGYGIFAGYNKQAVTITYVE
ncbi:MAG: hypothetical protein RL679_1090 [Bacteroidota bacterium]